MTDSARRLRKLVSTKAYISGSSPPEPVPGINSVIASVGASLGMKDGKTANGGSNQNENTTLSTAVIAGAVDPVRLLSLTAENVRNSTELHMGRKGMKSIHPNFQHFVNLEILWLNQNELTAVKGLLPSDSLSSLSQSVKGGANTKGAPQKVSSSKDSAGRLADQSASTASPTGLNAAIQQKPMSSTLLLMQNTVAAMGGANARSGMAMAARSKEKELKRAEEEEKELMRRVRGNGEDKPGNESAKTGSSSPSSGDLSLNATLAVPPRGCKRIKHLYLNENRITTLDGDIQSLKYLETLLLANNLLSDMQAVSKRLRHLQCLKHLDLYGNPLAEQQGYRLYMIARHPTLQILDRERITDTERRLAKEAFGNKRFDAEALTSRHLKGSGGGLPAGGGASFNMTSLAERESVGSNSVHGGNNNIANGSDASEGAGENNFANMSAKERSLMRSAVGFGAAVPPAKPMQRAETISASVAILESKASMIQAEHQAARRRAKDKEAAELAELAEQRRLFHTAWESAAAHQERQQQAELAAKKALAVEQSRLELSMGLSGGGGKKKSGAGSLNNTLNGQQPQVQGGGGPAGAGKNGQQQLQQQQLQNTDQLQAQQRAKALGEYKRLQATAAHHRSLNAKERLVSRIFHLDSDKASDHRIVEIIELQRRREEANNIGDEDQVLAIEAELLSLQHGLLPERDADVFKKAMIEQNKSTVDEDSRRYNTHIVEKVMLFPGELTMVKKQFSERGSVFSLDRLRHLLMACLSSVTDGGDNTASLQSSSPTTMKSATNTAGSSSTFALGAFLTPALLETAKKAFIEKYPAAAAPASGSFASFGGSPASTSGRRSSRQSLPTIRNSNRALSIVSVTPNSGTSQQQQTSGSALPESSSIKPRAGANNGKKAGTSSPQPEALASTTAPLSPTTPTKTGTSFSVDPALFMAVRDAGNAEAGLMTPIAVYDALILLSRLPLFVAVKRKLVEQLALNAMQQHQYARLKELQQRVNDLSAHLASLRANMAKRSEGGAGAFSSDALSSMVFLPPSGTSSAQGKRYSTVSSSSYSTAAFAAATQAASAHHEDGAGHDAQRSTSAVLGAEAALLEGIGYVDLANVKALWGSVLVRLKERAEEQRPTAGGNTSGVRAATPAVAGGGLSAGALAANSSAAMSSPPLINAGRKR